MKKIYLLTVLIFIISLSFMAEATETLPRYNLSVAFDVKNNLLQGTARIIFPDHRERTISIAHLKILSTMLNGEPFVPEMKNRTFKLNAKGTLKKKYELMEKNEVRFEIFECSDKMDILLAAYGTMARVCKTVISNIREKGIKVGLIRPISLYPFPYRAL